MKMLMAPIIIAAHRIQQRQQRQAKKNVIHPKIHSKLSFAVGTFDEQVEPLQCFIHAVVI
jgi:hypothetical protein